MDSRFIPLSVPNLSGNELEYVSQAIKTEWVSTNGKYVNEFENGISNYVKSKGAVACQNGTSGLHIALLICGVERDDIVLVPTLTFIAAVNPIKYIGAEPIFIDCDDTLCIDPEKIESFCENECDFSNGVLTDKATGKKVKAVIAVHVFGNMADVEKINGIARKYNLKVIEDATEALGTHYTSENCKGKFAGTLGDVGVYSFNGNKIITTGGGGMIVSDDEDLLKHAKHLTTQAKSDELYYIHDEIGFNYRMTNIAAALGLAQLEQLESFIEVKNKNYNYYCSKFENYNKAYILPFGSNICSNKWFYSLVLNSKEERDFLIKSLQSYSIQTRPIWGLIHEQLPYRDCRAYKIEKASYYYERIVNIPCSTNLSESDIDYVVECITKLL